MFSKYVTISCLSVSIFAMPAAAARVGSGSVSPGNGQQFVGASGLLAGASSLGAGVLAHSSQSASGSSLALLLSGPVSGSIINVGPVSPRGVAPRTPGLTSATPRISDPGANGGIFVVPLPTSAWMGLSLLATMGAITAARKSSSVRAG